MVNGSKKLFVYSLTILLVLIAGFANWRWPLYLFLGDTPIYRFVWLGIFFIILDIVIEVILKIGKQIRLMAEAVIFSNGLKKISSSFKIISGVSLPSHINVDYVIVGSSGVWTLNIREESGRITFNGDDIIKDGSIVIGRLLPTALEKSYSLASFIKDKTGQNVIVTPVIVFISNKAVLEEIPKSVRGVFISSGKDVIPLVENTDIQIIDQNMIDNIYKILKK